MPIHQSDQSASLPVGIALTGTAKTTTIHEPTNGSLPPSTPKDTIKKLSWLTGFLTHWKTTQPKKTQELQSPNSNSQSRITQPQAQKACDKTEQVQHMHPMIKPNSPLLPTTQVNELSKKKPSTHSRFSQRYDLRVCLEGVQGQVLSEWEAISTLLLQVHAIDNNVKLCPWRGQDNTNHSPIDLDTINNTFFDLQVYAPRLASQQEGWRTSLASGQMRYPYLFLESLVKPSYLVAKLSPWLRETQQGMWMRQLPVAEQTVCLGWLLFSTPEYDRRELQRIIKETSGEDVALRYHTIQMGAKGPTTKETTTVKALHMEADITLSPAQ